MKIVIDILSLLKSAPKSRWVGLKSGQQLVKKLKKLNKDCEILIYLNGLEAKTATYWLTDNKIQYNELVTSIDGDVFVSTKAHKLEENHENWVAYDILGKRNKYFKSGDVVELKSGSLPMTIKSVNPESGIAYVSWFDFDACPFHSEFPFTALKLTDEDWHSIIDDDKEKMKIEDD